MRAGSTMRVLVVDEVSERASILREGLEKAGYEVSAQLSSALDLMQAVEQFQPDVVIIDTASPTRDVIEHIALVSRDRPRPIVMFASDGHSATIRQAVGAGVTAYIVDGLDANRVAPIIEVAVARFESFHSLRKQLADAQSKLSDRKVIERARGLIMRARKVSEDEAYASMRNLAMSRGKRLVDVAQQIIDAADLLT